MSIQNNFHSDLLVAQKLAYEPSGLSCRNIIQETESQDYGACVFELNNKTVKFRVAKTTPTKTGQFVTVWKRIGSGPIMPFDLADPIDFFVISVRNGEKIGQFVFPKNILSQKGILSKDGKGGKRAIRVYAPWDAANSEQAKRTQAWQHPFFLK